MIHQGAVEQAVQFDHLQGARRGKSAARELEPTSYRGRGKAWRDKAAALPDDNPERAVCVELAEGYERVATLLEQRRWHPVP